MAGMRNILVHAYARVREDLVRGAAKRLPADAERISRLMVEGLRGEKVDPQRVSDVAAKLRSVFEGKVKAAFLFGGRAKGYELKGDYDVAVYFGRDFDLYEAGALVADVAAALGVSEELIDLVVLDSAPPELVLEALDGLPVYVEDPLAVFELRFRSLREAIDIEACRHDRPGSRA